MSFYVREDHSSDSTSRKFAVGFYTPDGDWLDAPHATTQLHTGSSPSRYDVKLAARWCNYLNGGTGTAFS